LTEQLTPADIIGIKGTPGLSSVALSKVRTMIDAYTVQN